MIDCVCRKCGRMFSVVPSQLKYGKGRYCSHSCAASVAAINRDQAGPRNPKWKGGVKSVGRKGKYRSKYPGKSAAHDELTKAIRSGKVTRKPCEQCGNINVEGHHKDYSKQLEVVWLCKRHHMEAHGGRLDNGL